MTGRDVLIMRRDFNIRILLIEVNMAILVAAGGLLSIISYFPLGLRQGVMAKADMSESMFANSFFETISENVKRIENVAEWNNIDRFWQAAVEGTGIERNLKTIQAAKSSNMSEATKQLFYKFNGPSGANSPSDTSGERSQNPRRRAPL